MIVKVVDAPAVAGGKAIALCHDNGEMVEGQISCSVENGVGDYGTVTVRLTIDGERVRMEGAA